VVLCAPDGSAAGTAPKETVHHRDTPLPLAFSCYLLDPAGRVLVTRLSHDKRTFPGVRTNSCCGHPSPGEGMGIASASPNTNKPTIRLMKVALSSRCGPFESS